VRGARAKRRLNARSWPNSRTDLTTHAQEAVLLISGSCHCGNIGFELLWEPEPAEIPARACTCSFCTKHGGVWTSCSTGTLTVVVADKQNVSHYTFGTRTAQFHICAICGVVPLVTSEIDGNIYAVVNVNAFQDIDRSLLKNASVTFDAEDEQSRLVRRKRNWIPRVGFSDGDA
jgi:hypothetical protein